MGAQRVRIEAQRVRIPFYVPPHGQKEVPDSTHNEILSSLGSVFFFLFEMKFTQHKTNHFK